MFFYACLLLMTLTNILVPLWAHITLGFLVFFQNGYVSTEELYMDDVELSHTNVLKTIKDASAVEKRSHGSGYLYAFSPSLYQIIMAPNAPLHHMRNVCLLPFGPDSFTWNCVRAGNIVQC
ncbi:uncharacterized protein EV420DRAFT_1521208 [Desarmillaria tabescens]|uniref:Uncharacterized protein n=1 Tax=Armillaria tabescens TaxID=1929756 RepID=A0AA39NBZ2_ARMTA|nr:uncharacterized protein EV420DRAFT_1521208 [Desarmillaria tabescens]KAK0462835.1 hypothetical protein EV420DRAFT_1521208 [Desarmillaria tabescens]